MDLNSQYNQKYQQAQEAYMKGNYEDAKEIIDRLVHDFSDDPAAHLLRGYLYCYGFQQYDVAQQEYESVLKLTYDPDYIDYARKGIDYIGCN